MSAPLSWQSSRQSSLIEKFHLLTSPSNMGVKKGETRLREKLDDIIAAMRKDGSLNELALKWLKQPLPKDF